MTREEKITKTSASSPALRRLAVSLALSAVVIAASCDKKKKRKTPDGPALQAVPGEVETFGEKIPGFLHWLSSDGGHAVVYRFLHDTDGDGTIETELGDHGEPGGDEPSISLIDTGTDAAEEFDELVATGPLQRRLVLRRGESLVLYDALDGQQTMFEDADPAPDEANPCLPARQASFDPTGRYLGYLTSRGAVVRDLENGESVRYDAPDGKLWRAETTPRGWLVFQHVTEDSDEDGALGFPRQKTSCACRWCRRFATSSGAYGWEGDRPSSTLVGPGGIRQEIGGRVIPLSDAAVYSVRQHRLERPDGSPIELPKRCRTVMVPAGESRMVVRCGQKLGLFDPDTREFTPRQPASEGRAARIDPLGDVSVPFGGWIAARARAGASQKLARFSLDDGSVDVGPMVTQIGTPHHSGWILAASSDTLYVFDLATGALESAPMKVLELDGLTFRTAEGWHVIDPNTGKFVRAGDKPDLVAGNGCFAIFESKKTIGSGPWRVTCP